MQITDSNGTTHTYQDERQSRTSTGERICSAIAFAVLFSFIAAALIEFASAGVK